ncbi:MAG TPA: DUF4132 domain-containing protein, partial [Glycomyces sp.]|nr:DUF4132 domain-containing protein [Glycomyces sp.]
TDWTAQVCEEIGEAPGVHSAGLPWTLVGDTDHLKRLGRPAIRPREVTERTVAELAGHLGAASMPILAATLRYKSLNATQRAVLFEAVAALPLDEAMAFLVDRDGEPQVPPALRSAAARFPVRAARTVAARAATLPTPALTRLTGVLRADPGRYEAALVELTEDERAALDDRTALPAAGPDRLPPLLTAPPWTERPRRSAGVPDLGLEPPSVTTLVWDAVEYERAKAIEPAFERWDEPDYWDDISGQVVNRVELSLDDAVWGQLAHGGTRSAEAVVERLRSKPRYGGALVPIRSSKAAMLALDWLARPNAERHHAVAWLGRHGVYAVPFLVPVALAPGRRRRVAEAALRHLADRIGEEAVERGAEPYGPEAAARIAALLAADPAAPPLGTEPRPGDWADPGLLPPVLLRERDAVLPRSAVPHLVAVLSLWSPPVPYRGTDVVAETCDPESLTRFSHALFELWLAAGAPASDPWAVSQLARFGTDATVALLEPMIARWPGANQPDLAALGVEALAAIGTERAFNALYAISRMGKFPDLMLLARSLAEQVAARHGSEVEPLADRLAPDHGLADPESLTLDYGARRFRVRFDDLLRPRLVDESGKTRARPPRPGARDDHARAKAAAERFKRLTKDVEDAAEEQARRLRKAMLAGRTWSLDAFRRLAEHPVISSPARRLVWRTGDGTGFRLSEDGGLTDVHERELEPREGMTVRLAHPALLGGELPAWIELFNDYAILQPFDQLSRPAMAFTAEEAETGRLRRFEGATATMGALLESLEWRSLYASPQNFGVRSRGFERRVPGGLLLVDIDPAPDTREPDPDGRHRLLSVRLMTTRNRHPDHAAPLPGARLDPVTASELLADLAAAVGR